MDKIDTEVIAYWIYEYRMNHRIVSSPQEDWNMACRIKKEYAYNYPFHGIPEDIIHIIVMLECQNKWK